MTDKQKGRAIVAIDVFLLVISAVLWALFPRYIPYLFK
jgi:hypothetical protein